MNVENQYYGYKRNWGMKKETKRIQKEEEETIHKMI